MDTMVDSSNVDVHGTSSRHRPTSLDAIAFTRGTAQPPSACLSLSTEKSGDNLNGNPSSDVQPQVTQEQFASIVIKADSRIPKSRLKDVIYLCHDKVRDLHVLERAQSAKDIFEDMNVSGSLTPRNIILVSELLHRMGMLRDKSTVFKGTNVEWKLGMPSSLDDFRTLLYSIAEQIPRRDFKKMKDVCLDQELIEPYQLEDCNDFLDFFILLEDEALLEEDNIGLLKDFTNVLNIQKVTDYVAKYEEQMMMQKRPVLSITQEVSKRLMTLRTFMETDGTSTQRDIIGSEIYSKILQKWYQQKEEANFSNDNRSQDSTANNTYSLMKVASGLVTPSMIIKDFPKVPSAGSAPGSVKAQAGCKLDQSGDAAALKSLKSRDVEMDDAGSEGDEKGTSSEEEDDPYTTSHQTLFKKKFPTYPMDKSPKGICLIISNKTFLGNNTEREGTEIDVVNLKKTFGEQLDFEVHIKENLTAEEMREELKKWRDYDHKPSCAFICCLLSHGNKGVVMGTDGEPLLLSDAMGYFKGNCPSLTDKPKVFIVQACQGEKWQPLTTQSIPKSPTGESVGIGSMVLLPNETDFILLLSTVPGFKSARSKKKGSWFIMALTKIYQAHPGIEIHAAMIVVNHQLSKVTNVRENDQDDQEISQTAFPSNTLRKLLFFQQPAKMESN